MLKIRLKRVGRKHDPSFRLVVLESQRGPKSGDYVENLGSYNARTDEKTIHADRVKHWISVGAQPSDTAHNLLVELGIITGKKVNVLPKKNPIIKEGGEEKPETSSSEKKTASAEETPKDVAAIEAEAEAAVEAKA